MSTELAAAETQPFTATTVQAGSTIKNSPTLTINFPTQFSTIPVVVLSATYQSALQSPDIITAVSPSQFTVTSGNMAGNYYVNWIACAPR
jgi:hypothetical protein